MRRLKKLSQNYLREYDVRDKLLEDIRPFLTDNYYLTMQDDNDGSYLRIHDKKLECELDIRVYFNEVDGQFEYEILDDYAHYDKSEYQELLNFIKKWMSK